MVKNATLMQARVQLCTDGSLVVEHSLPRNHPATDRALAEMVNRGVITEDVFYKLVRKFQTFVDELENDEDLWDY